jgi:uncharacterized protein with HEPN domain
MKSNKLYLKNILDSILSIEDYVKGYTFKKFEKDQLRIDAVSKRIEEIGENIKKISVELKKKNKKISWEYWEEVRNFLVHVYGMLNKSRLWKIIKKDLPLLRKEINFILKN